ncbi:Homeobox-leucine zipper protein HOX32 [Platanthera guangdongensis]|uniref:Homeobox-leucine zipper protein HOX32 n=1 Tax=Platanthera guangdongensis TaxID=2320717 RepID=A0ABR2M4V4_9ASPA
MHVWQDKTKSVLAVLQGVVKKAVGLGGWHWLICMRSLTASIGGPSGPTTPNFVRAEMLSSGYLIRPCEGGGSMIHIVDHLDLDAWSVPEVLRPLYESPKILAQKMTIANVPPSLLVQFLREHRSE